MSSSNSYDVVIIGAGIVGLSFAKLLSLMKLKVALVEADLPVLETLAPSLNARVSAINRAAEDLFDELGVWTILKAVATPILQMKVWDAQSAARLEFDGAELGVSHLGSIVENRLILHSLWQDLQQDPQVDFYCPMQAKSIQIDDHQARLCLIDDRWLNARLIVGCDGAHSWLRQQMKADLQVESYEQKAIVAVIHCAEAHRQIAWQNFLSTGPLALLPLVDPHQCAIVWSCDTSYADELMRCETKSFNVALTNASEFCLGSLELLTNPQAIPLLRRQARHYVEPRLALLGDAAHTMHPLAGQGVNFGLMDARYLAQLIGSALSQGRDIGSYKLLRRYERARKSENELMLRSVGVFKALFGIRAASIVQLRAWGMQTLNRASCLKERMAHYAMYG